MKRLYEEGVVFAVTLLFVGAAFLPNVGAVLIS
jgi:hypothetical protein